MHATKVFGAPEVDAAHIIKAQLQLFRCQAAGLGKVPGCAGVAGVVRLPPITEAARGDEDCDDGGDATDARCRGAPRSQSPSKASAPMPGCHGGGKRGGGAKSNCVKRVEEMQRQREARRQHAAETKVQRAAAVEEAQAMLPQHRRRRRPMLPPLPPPLMLPLPPPPARAPRAAAPHAVEGIEVFGTPHAPKLVVAVDATGAVSAAGACTRAGAALRGGLGETKVHW